VTDYDALPPGDPRAKWAPPRPMLWPGPTPNQVPSRTYLEAAALASIIAGLGVIGTLVDPFLSLLADDPAFAVVAVSAAVGFGLAFTSAAIGPDRVVALMAGLAYGVLVGVVGAAVLGMGIGVIFAWLAWPITIPCGIGWVVAFRSRRRFLPSKHRTIAVYLVATALTAALLFLRLTNVLSS
jgi:hypothetical protein